MRVLVALWRRLVAALLMPKLLQAVRAADVGQLCRHAVPATPAAVREQETPIIWCGGVHKEDTTAACQIDRRQPWSTDCRSAHIPILRGGTRSASIPSECLRCNTSADTIHVHERNTRDTKLLRYLLLYYYFSFYFTIIVSFLPPVPYTRLQ